MSEPKGLPWFRKIELVIMVAMLPAFWIGLVGAWLGIEWMANIWIAALAVALALGFGGLAFWLISHGIRLCLRLGRSSSPEQTAQSSTPQSPPS